MKPKTSRQSNYSAHYASHLVGDWLNKRLLQIDATLACFSKTQRDATCSLTPGFPKQSRSPHAVWSYAIRTARACRALEKCKIPIDAWTPSWLSISLDSCQVSHAGSSANELIRNNGTSSETEARQSNTLSQFWSLDHRFSNIEKASLSSIVLSCQLHCIPHWNFLDHHNKKRTLHNTSPKAYKQTECLKFIVREMTNKELEELL